MLFALQNINPYHRHVYPQSAPLPILSPHPSLFRWSWLSRPPGTGIRRLCRDRHGHHCPRAQAPRGERLWCRRADRADSPLTADCCPLRPARGSVMRSKPGTGVAGTVDETEGASVSARRSAHVDAPRSLVDEPPKPLFSFPGPALNLPLLPRAILGCTTSCLRAFSSRSRG